jgi:hypothetical protein
LMKMKSGIGYLVLWGELKTRGPLLCSS